MTYQTIPEILTALWKGKRFQPQAYPTLGGIVKEVREVSAAYEGSWLYVEYETTEGYSIMDFEEQFTVEDVTDAQPTGAGSGGADDSPAVGTSSLT